MSDYQWNWLIFIIIHSKYIKIECLKYQYQKKYLSFSLLILNEISSVEYQCKTRNQLKIYKNEDEFNIPKQNQSNVQKPSNTIMRKPNLRIPDPLDDQNKKKLENINILYPKENSRLQFSSQIQQILASDQSNSNIVLASFVGRSRIGKSFLVDTLISDALNKISRQMSNKGRPYVNATIINQDQQNKMAYLDCHGDVTNETFLWCYFLSGVIVLSLNKDNQNSEAQFLEYLYFISNKLDEYHEDLSPPLLIIVHRDCDDGLFDDSQFIKQIKEYDLFQPEIYTTSLPYPGIKSGFKQLPDDLPDMLKPQYKLNLKHLRKILHKATPKAIKNNHLSSKLLSLVLQPLTKSINKGEKIFPIKIWQDVMQTLSLGYYNYYIKCYSEQFSDIFQDEQPLDRYNLFKKLRYIKKEINKKVVGFNSISGEPIFQKYYNLLKQKIESQQQIIKKINRQKSMQRNHLYCQKLFIEMNDNNYKQLIQKYSNSNLDDGKSEVLLNNFQNIIQNKLSKIQNINDSSKKPSKQIQILENQLNQLDQQINIQKSLKLQNIEQNILLKKQEIKNSQSQYQKIKQQLEQKNQIKDPKINQNTMKLKKQVSDLKFKIQEQQNQIKNVNNRNKNKISSEIQTLDANLKIQEKKLLKLQAQIQNAKDKANKNKDKDATCCELM